MSLVEKTTIVRSAEPLKIKATPFAKGYRMEITWVLDPANPIAMDQLMLSRERSNLRKSIDLFKTNIIEGDLHSKLMTDDD